MSDVDRSGWVRGLLEWMASGLDGWSEVRATTYESSADWSDYLVTSGMRQENDQSVERRASWLPDRPSGIYASPNAPASTTAQRAQPQR